MPYAEVPRALAAALRSPYSCCLSMQEYQPASCSTYEAPYIARSFLGVVMDVMMLLTPIALAVARLVVRHMS